MPRGGRIKGTKNVKDLYAAYERQYEKAVKGRYGGEGAFEAKVTREEFNALFARMKQLQKRGQKFKQQSNVTLIKTLVSSQRAQSFKFRQQAPKMYRKILQEQGYTEKQAEEQAAKAFEGVQEAKEIREDMFFQYVTKKMVEEGLTLDKARARFEEYYY